MTIDVLDEKKVIANLSLQENIFFDDYYAFYSSWYGGIITNPRLMLLPMDDHMVHRGDGVFEAIKAIDRRVYMLDEHLHRLIKSAKSICLEPPFSFEEMKNIILETLKVANQNNVYIRLFVSRGPGNFSANPYDAMGSQFYVIITKFKPLPEEKYSQGVKVGQSFIPAKESWLAQVKSCNYLPNVMMKKESVDRDLDFVVSINATGHVTESATENIMLLDENDVLVSPKLDHILKGTTMTRISELARENGIKTELRYFYPQELLSAHEVMMSGTTLDILPVIAFENQSIATGKPGPIAKKLRELLLEDIKSGPLSTKF